VEPFDQVIEQESFLAEQGLLGLFRKKHLMVRQQLLINLQYFKELDRLKLILFEKGLRDVFLVKGAFLLREVYADMSQRSMSDVDLYIPELNSYQLLQEILKDQGYEVLVEKKWQANNFKTTLIKKIGNFYCTLELHQKLIWNEGKNCWNKKSEDGPWSFLDTNDHLVYLIAHMGKQHSFLKLFWLYDIKLYVEKFGAEVDWQIVYEKLKDLNCSTCLQLTAKLMLEIFKTDLFPKIKKFHFSKIKFYLQRKVFTPNHFTSEKRSYWGIFFAKFLVKDNNWETLRYLFFYRRAR
jgi:hypothetical protein